MNCPTVLKILRKFKNPIIVNRWKHQKDNNFIHIQNPYGVYRWNYDFEFSGAIGDVLKISMFFYKNCNHTQGRRIDYRYSLILSKDSVWIFYNTINKGRLTINHDIQHLSLSDVPYEDLESALFQQSLLGDTGMIGSQEAKVIQELKDIYFPEEK